MSSTTKRYSQGNWICTEVRVDQIKYEWEIKDFKALTENNQERIDSPTFPGGNDRRKWRLTLFPRGVRNDNSEFVSLFLCLESAEVFGIEVKGELTMTQSNFVKARVSIGRKYDKADGWGSHDFLELSKLLVDDSTDDAITVCCKFDIFENVITSSSESATKKQRASFHSGRSRFGNGFRPLFGDQNLSDFTIIVGKKRFPSHKAILSSRSPVFAAMFEHPNMRENRENLVRIKGIKPDVIKAMLEFIYTDDVTNIREIAKELLEAAEKYQIDGLKALCEETLFIVLNKENAADILSTADFYNAEQLKKYVLQYIADHRGDVVNSEGFQSTEMSSTLYQELLRALAPPTNGDTRES